MKVHVTIDTPFMLDFGLMVNFPANVWDLTLFLKILIFRTQSHGNPPNTSSGIFMQDSAPAPLSLRTLKMTTRKFLQLWLKKLFAIEKGYEGIRSIVGKTHG